MKDSSYCDTHAHLCDDRYDADRVQVAEEALEEGLSFIVDVGVDRRSWRKSRELAEQVDRVFVTVGWHPHDASKVEPGDIAAELDAAWFDKTVAVGEIGLDYHYDFSPRKVQCEVFRAQLAYAVERGRPVVIHVREAWKDAFAVLDEFCDGLPEAGGGRAAVVHCFTADRNEARRLLDMGFFLSFTGLITFPSSTWLRNLLEYVPPDRVFFETDSPYLTPRPHRGKRNHPRNVRLVVEAAAGPMGMTTDELAIASTNTARLFFGIPGGEEPQ